MITVTKLLVTLNVLVFVAMVATGGSPTNFDGETLLRFGANYGPATMGGEPWRLFTYMFEHGGILHIALNMWCLWNLGPLAEQIFGEMKVLVLYVVTGLGAGLTSLLVHPGGLSVGASGAIFGIAGALIAALYWRKLPVPEYVTKQYLSSILRFAGINLVLGYFMARTDNSAHVGGILAGLACGLILPLSRQANRPDNF